MEMGKTPAGADGIFHHAPEAFDVIVTTHKTIDLVFHTQVCKLKREMTHKNAVSASSVAFMPNEGMEVIDETPVHAPATDCSRPASVGAPPQGAHDHAGTPGEPSWKLPSMRVSRPVSNHTQGPSRVNGARSSILCSTTGGRCCPSMRLWMRGSAVPGLIARPSTVCATQPGAASATPWGSYRRIGWPGMMRINGS